MILFKFKSLGTLDHVLDILLNDRLYCAPYSNLNDPFEGQFIAQNQISDRDWMQIFSHCVEK